MKKKRYTEAQIAFALLQAESGVHAKEVIWKMRITEQTFYRWTKQCFRMRYQRSSEAS